MLSAGTRVDGIERCLETLLVREDLDRHVALACQGLSDARGKTRPPLLGAVLSPNLDLSLARRAQACVP